MHDQAVLIGRFQPFHKEHARLLEDTLKEAHHVTILLGSYNSSRNFRNPWTCEERNIFIQSAIPDAQKDRISFSYIRDYLYNDNNWISQVQNKVAHCGKAIVKTLKKDQIGICLSGAKKDGTSQYLDYFPHWKKMGSVIHKPMNATDIREKYFSETVGWENDLPDSVVDCLIDWKRHYPALFERMAEEQRFIERYKAAWMGAPYPPIFVTVDPVVVCGGHILVVRRGGMPGEGLYALPGGFLDKGETVKEGAIRELLEETNLVVPHHELVNSMGENKVFDHPLRSLRGRTITHAQLFVLNMDIMPRIQAGDDAAHAEWLSLSDLQENEDQFYEDHFHIINHFVSRL